MLQEINDIDGHCFIYNTGEKWKPQVLSHLNRTILIAYSIETHLSMTLVIIPNRK